MPGYIETFKSVDDAYLEHFGIVGMKWGSRRASYLRKKGDAYRTKAYVKAKNVENEMNKRTTKRTQAAIKKVSNGKAFLESVLLGDYGALVYNASLAKGNKKGKAIAQAITNETVNNLTFGRLSKKARW